MAKPSPGKTLGIVVQDLGDDRGLRVQGFSGGKAPKGSDVAVGDLILSIDGKKVSTISPETVAATLLSGLESVSLQLGRRYVKVHTRSTHLNV